VWTRGCGRRCGRRCGCVFYESNRAVTTPNREKAHTHTQCRFVWKARTRTKKKKYARNERNRARKLFRADQVGATNHDKWPAFFAKRPFFFFFYAINSKSKPQPQRKPRTKCCSLFCLCVHRFGRLAGLFGPFFDVRYNPCQKKSRAPVKTAATTTTTSDRMRLSWFDEKHSFSYWFPTNVQMSESKARSLIASSARKNAFGFFFFFFFFLSFFFLLAHVVGGGWGLKSKSLASLTLGHLGHLGGSDGCAR